MAQRNEIVKFLNAFFEEGIAAWPDDPNGLSVEGAPEVVKIITGVSPSLELFEKAVQKGAQMVVCHHFLNLEENAPVFEKKRADFLREHKLSFVNYHLPLDFHNEIGNNVLALNELGFEKEEPIFWNGCRIGSRLGKPVDLANVLEKAENVYCLRPFVFAFGPETVTNIAVSTGSGAFMAAELVREGVGTLITGEVKEPTQEMARELGVNILACGHYNTEKAGIGALGKILKDKFKVEVEFIDIPNPV